MTKEVILQKSMELFATKGYFNTSMDDISKAVNIKKASLYFHFSGKESIFQAVFDSILEDYALFWDSLTQTEDGADSVKKLANIFTLYVKSCKDNMKMSFWDRYYYYPPDCFKEYIQSKTYEIEMSNINRIVRIIESGIQKNEIKSLNARNAALSFYYMMTGLALSVKFFTNEALDEEISKCLEPFTAMLAR